MAATPSDTDELIKRARGGDPAARGAILASYRDRLRRMIAGRLDRRLAARVDPSDVVQEALADAARGLPGYLSNPPLPLFPWLRQFARERLAKLHRRHIRAGRRSVAREDCRAGGSAACAPAAGGSSPSGRLIRDETRQRVRDAMERLPEGDRRVLVLRDIEALPVAGVAAALGISEGAAKVRHLRALRRLQSLLEGPP
jgi:RNA polymerase sigma-70 factor (ECF subfamily)